MRVRRVGRRGILLLGALTLGAAPALAQSGGAGVVVPVVNTASLVYRDVGNEEVRATAEATVSLLVPSPVLRLDKTVDRASAAAGERLRWTLVFGNDGDAVAAGALLADTLPAGTRLVAGSILLNGLPLTEAADADAATVATLADGRDELRVALGDLAAGSSGTLVVEGDLLPAAGGSLVNVASLTSGALAVHAEAATAVAAGTLALAKSAGAVEARIGDLVPYAIVVRNSGGSALAGVVVRDRLPEGTRLVERSVAGADSVRVTGRDVAFWVPSPLAPGEERTVRYAVVVLSAARSARLENLALAEAEGGAVTSPLAVAVVRLRAGSAGEGRTLVGKVWVDLDDDGRQEAGEPGVAGARVLTADGEMVIADREGRFSLRDLIPGTHVLRLDTAGLPAGYALPRPGDAMALVRTDGWTMPRVEFRLVGTRGPEGCACEGKHAGHVAGDAGLASLASVSGASDSRDPAGRPSVAALRSDSARDEEGARAFLAGTPVRLTSPADGSVIASNRLFVGVRGEPGRDITLYDGDSVIRRGRIRGDGIADFVAVELAPGPHVLRAAMSSSFGGVRWDSLAVHRTGLPARLVVEGAPAALHAEAAAEAPVVVRVLDAWGVAASDAPAVTVEAEGAAVDAADADASSVGLQLRADAAGVVRVPLRGGARVGPASLALLAGAARAAVPLRVLPTRRALVATGVGQLGVGAAPESFGALTVRGAVGSDAALSVSWDSRRAGGEREEQFARGIDPLDASRYPTYGDGSERRVEPGAGSQAFSARLERGWDWIQAGDIATGDVAGSRRLGGYSRALTGVSARVGTGAIVWKGFGSLTEQAVRQVQLRGDGGSGPYILGADIRPGTERVALEVRAADNAARLLAREELVRYLDYEIDYVTGTVLLRRPVPAADPYGNPIFLAATVEQRSGEKELVAGVRVEADAGRLLAPGAFAGARDSLGLGVTVVRDRGVSAAGVSRPRDIAGADVRLRRGLLSGGVELLHASGDTAATAVAADARLTTAGEGLALDVAATRVGEGFGTTLDPRLRTAFGELRVGAELRLADSARIRVEHAEQRFDVQDAARATTAMRVDRLFAGRRMTQELSLASDRVGATGAGSSTVGSRTTVAVDPRLDLWLEGSRALDSDSIAARPDQLGIGAAWRIARAARLEGSHRWVQLADTASYQVSSIGVRAETPFGSQLWGGVERAAAARASHAATLGWTQRLALAHGWSVSTMVERRIGLSRASLADPTRALPFAQPESDRLSLGGAVEWLPGSDMARASLRAELHDGDDRKGHRVELAGDAPLGAGAALLARVDRSLYDRPLGAGPTRSVDERSLVGLALRPVTTAALDALLRLEYRRTSNPLGTSTVALPGDDRRVIAASDVVWSPARGLELAGRWAARLSEVATAPGAEPLALRAHFLGGRVRQDVGEAWGIRLDARGLLEAGSAASAWSLAPSLARRLDDRMEMEAGWRFGTLRDRDFGSDGAGFFLLLNLRITERDVRAPAAVWRERISRGR